LFPGIDCIASTMNNELNVARIPNTIKTSIGGKTPELKKRDDANGIDGPVKVN
jgi:hypothetical protein